ncbi:MULTISPECIES: hypothetical protein [unclassified Actinotalea]|uniref:hypothetical protein n=1 Tax=unclassified Actinotalea TaxID=2638618 RepID=UPI0015F52C37|nr:MULTISPECIES: hypothetical protein [unclassified Actinotalea]
MPAPRPVRVASAGVPVLLLALALTACAADDAPVDKSPKPVAASPAAGATPSPTPTPTPAPTPTERPLPEQQLHAGPVGDGVPATVSGSGSAVVGYTRQGETALVVGIDCTACAGEVVVTAPDRGEPWGQGPAPYSGSYLLDIFRDTAPEQAVVVHAEGPWTLTLESWNDLELVTGPQQGTGSTVLFLGDTAGRLEVSYTPAGPEDSFHGRAYSAVDVDASGNPATVLFGDSAPFADTYEIAMPGVLAIMTNGAWTVTPVP